MQVPGARVAGAVQGDGEVTQPALDVAHRAVSRFTHPAQGCLLTKLYPRAEGWGQMQDTDSAKGFANFRFQEELQVWSGGWMNGGGGGLFVGW